jgi:NADPH:quinone reductase-like Zn-dependent oxidoreductase
MGSAASPWENRWWRCPPTAPGGYASIYVRDQAFVVWTEGHAIDPALAVAVLPNAIMAHVALTRVVTLPEGETILVHGGLGALAAAFPRHRSAVGRGTRGRHGPYREDRRGRCDQAAL